METFHIAPFKIKRGPLFLFITFLILTLTSCGLTTTRPKLEMSFAQSAFLAAREVNAQVLASALYRKAEYYYLKAKSSYRRKYFNKAKQYAILSRRFAEKAELMAIKKKDLEEL